MAHERVAMFILFLDCVAGNSCGVNSLVFFVSLLANLGLGVGLQ